MNIIILLVQKRKSRIYDHDDYEWIHEINEFEKKKKNVQIKIIIELVTMVKNFWMNVQDIFYEV